MVLQKNTVLQSERVCVLGAGRVDGNASGNWMFQTELRYEFVSKILNEG